MSGEASTQGWDLPTRSTESTVRRLEPGMLLAGRYRILGLLGVGGMGMVYLADDGQLGLQVAVKVLRPDRAQDGMHGGTWLERFKQELVLARQVSHPNVVRIHDIGVEKGDSADLVFLTMDFVAGRSLRGLLAEEKRLAPPQAVEIARQLALALGAAHAAGVVHRDLKPGNVLLDESGSSLRAAITDFGIARSLAGSGLTHPGTVIGTLGYLSPEQARGDAVDGRSDLYSLGLLLYEMLTGDLPFASGSDAEMLAQRMTGAPRHLPWAGAKVPPRLSEVVHRLLATDPARRYQTAEDFIRDLDRSATIAFFHLSPRLKKIAAATACLLALLAAGWAVRQRAWPGGQAARQERRPAAPAGPRHAVALLPLADDTGRPDLAWVATGMPEMLAAALAESPELRVLDSRQVVSTLADLKLPAGPLPEPEARRLAVLLDADRLVSGRVHAVGGQLRIDLTLAAAVPGQPPTTMHAEAPESEAFRFVEQLGGTLRRQLAVPPPVVEVVASRSPAALADYAQGAASLARGDALAAVPALERAVAADPRYTAAWVELAQARKALGRGEPALDAARKAVETLRPGVSRAADEARAVEARLLGRPDRAQEILSRLLARYPDDVEARIALAEAYGEQGRLDRAAAALEAAVRLAPHHPRLLFLLGRYAVEAGNARKAVDEYLVRALVVQNELGSEQGRAEVLNAFGVAYRNLGEMDRAVENYELAAALRKKIGDERGYATTLRNLATIHDLRGEHTAAEAQLGEALALLQKLGDKPGIADIYNEFGAFAEQRGDYGEALERYRQSLRARRDLGDDLALAESFSNVGFACYKLGRYDDALVYWRQGLDLAKKSADPSGIVLATQNLGLLELARGNWDEAVKSYLTALRSSRELGMKEATAASLGYLGRLAQYQGRPSGALSSYTEALAVVRELGDRRGLAEFTLAAADTELELGMTDAAAERLRAAAELLREGKNSEQQAELDRLQGELRLARGAPGYRAAAAAALRRAVAEARESHSVVELLSARLSAAGLADRGREALAGWERLRAEADALGQARLRLRADELAAQAELAAGDAARAQTAARAGLDLSAACGGSAGAWRLHRLLALALEKNGRSAEAAAERRYAAEEIARVSRDLTPEQRKSFDRLAQIQARALP
ncbi:MAG TPA: tetratricopeptide repeat protein [Thermoanaerobaculia bacterium]|nr:tetratricopeptide repeat protein [Thermoanaerobaculia bacterium]